MASTVTITKDRSHGVIAIRAAIVADTDGSITATALPAFAGYLLALETNPGATAPTTLYDITLLDQHGHDVLEGVGANRSATATEKAAIVYSGTSDHPPVSISDTLTLTFANQSANGALIDVVLYVAAQ